MTSTDDTYDISTLTIGVLGGTGDQGRGLARRFAGAGLRVLLGSRDQQRADDAAAAAAAGVEGMTNEEVARRSDLVIVAVPWEGHASTLEGLREPLLRTIVVDCVNPLGFDSRGAFALSVDEGSAAQQAQALLPESTVVAAFHHLSAVNLLDDTIADLDCDVLVLGDDRTATDLVAALANCLPGVRGLYGGRLRNAHQVEAFTANLISINRRYRAHAALRITDVPLSS